LKNILFFLLASAAGIFFYLITSKMQPLSFDDEMSTSGISKITEPATLRATESGPVVGSSDKNQTHVWFGIPYAKPPVGPLRWRSPQPVKAWSKEFEALSRQPECLHQRILIGFKSGQKKTIIGAEDCLYLDIWAPRSAAENAAQIEEQLPVVVWLNGGGNKIGASGHISGHKFSGDQQLVFVSVNYRLGRLGFFSHRAIRNTAKNPRDSSGNYSLLDVIHALQWVEKNIANFGGDSRNVTIMGTADGGSHVMALVASPLAEGLFQKAIVQGGSAESTSIHEAENFYDDEHIPGRVSSSNEMILSLILDLHIASDRREAKDDINAMSDESIRAFLERESAESIINIDIDNPNSSEALLSEIPQLIRDGNVLPETDFYTLFNDPISYNNVPMIIGSNLHDAKSSMLFESEYVSWILNRRPFVKDKEFFDLTSELRSNLKFILAVQEPAKLFSRSRMDVQAPPNIFAYRFDWSDIQPNLLGNWNKLIGAGNSLELDFLFYHFDRQEGLPNWYSNVNLADRKALSRSMMDYWGNFIHIGAPHRGRSANLAEWSPWKEQAINTLVLDNSVRGNIRMEKTDYDGERFKEDFISMLGTIKTREKCLLTLTSINNLSKISTPVSDHPVWNLDSSLCDHLNWNPTGY